MYEESFFDGRRDVGDRIDCLGDQFLRAISAQEKSERHVTVYIDKRQNERDKLMRAILRTRTGGGTRVQDALDLTMTERLNKIQGRKAMVVFTDGVDTSSRFARWQDVKERIEESGVIVYPIRYDTKVDVTSLFKASSLQPNVRNAGSGRIVKEYEQAAQSLKQFASVSGGRYYEGRKHGLAENRRLRTSPRSCAFTTGLAITRPTPRAMRVIAKFAWLIESQRRHTRATVIARHPARANNNSFREMGERMEESFSDGRRDDGGEGLTAWATCSLCAISAQEKVGQPVSVDAAALKGECMPARPYIIVNGRVSGSADDSAAQCAGEAAKRF